jgi:RNA polymerase sigma-70 factor (ECF subfamily)
MASLRSEEESRAFLAAQGVDAMASLALMSAVEQAIDQAVAAWPDVAVDRIGFAAYLGQRIPSDIDPVDALAARRLHELFLAFACAAGDAAACRHLDTRYLSEIVPLLRDHNIPTELAAEILQQVRMRLLTGERPSLLAYSGTGALRGWLRVTALRAAIRAQRKLRAHEPQDVAAALADATADPALQYQRRLYDAEFRAAFGHAVAALSVRERNLLKQSVLYGATIDELGALYHVHRATVARWLAAARERLADDTRLRMIAQLGIEPSDYDSIVQLIHSQLDISVARLLG